MTNTAIKPPTKADLDNLMHMDPNDMVKDTDARRKLVEALQDRRKKFVAKADAPSRKSQKASLPVALDDLDLDL